MFAWKLLAVPGAVVFAGLSYAIYDTFLESGSSEEQAAVGPSATSTASSIATRAPTLGPTTPPTPSRAPTPGEAVLVGAGDISSCTQNNDDRTAQLLGSIVANA